METWVGRDRGLGSHWAPQAPRLAPGCPRQPFTFFFSLEEGSLPEQRPGSTPPVPLARLEDLARLLSTSSSSNFFRLMNLEETRQLRAPVPAGCPLPQAGDRQGGRPVSPSRPGVPRGAAALGDGAQGLGRAPLLPRQRLLVLGAARRARRHQSREQHVCGGEKVRTHPVGQPGPPLQVGRQISRGLMRDSDPGGRGEGDGTQSRNVETAGTSRTRGGGERRERGDGGDDTGEVGDSEGHGDRQRERRGWGGGGRRGHEGPGEWMGDTAGRGRRALSGPADKSPRPQEDPGPPRSPARTERTQGRPHSPPERLRCRHRGLTIPGSGGSGRSAAASARPPPWTTAPLPRTHRKTI